MKADIAFAILVPASLLIRRRDPEQGLAIAPAGHVGVGVLQFEAEKFEELVVKLFRAGKLADAQNEMIDADHARHVRPPGKLATHPCHALLPRTLGSQLALSLRPAQDGGK